MRTIVRNATPGCPMPLNSPAQSGREEYTTHNGIKRCGSPGLMLLRILKPTSYEEKGYNSTPKSGYLRSHDDSPGMLPGGPHPNTGRPGIRIPRKNSLGMLLAEPHSWLRSTK